MNTKICSKCELVKNDDQYAKYYHSTQKAWRQRTVCRDCFNKQKKEYRELMKQKKSEPIIDPNLRLCVLCNQYKSLDDFYIRNKIKCKKCLLDYDREKRAIEFKEKGGSDRVPLKPNTYEDQIQRERTFELMVAFGYTFNEENGIWFKLPWKTPDGKFPLLGPTVKRAKHIKQKGWVRRTTEDIKNVIKLSEEGLSQSKISEKLNIPKITIYKWLKNHNSSESEN